jgi:hypothetical protein
MNLQFEESHIRAIDFRAADFEQFVFEQLHSSNSPRFGQYISNPNIFDFVKPWMVVLHHVSPPVAFAMFPLLAPKREDMLTDDLAADPKNLHVALVAIFPFDPRHDSLF